MEIVHSSDLYIEVSTTKYSTLFGKLSELLNGIEKEIMYVPDNSVAATITG